MSEEEEKKTPVWLSVLSHTLSVVFVVWFTYIAFFNPVVEWLNILKLFAVLSIVLSTIYIIVSIMAMIVCSEKERFEKAKVKHMWWVVPKGIMWLLIYGKLAFMGSIVYGSIGVLSQIMFIVTACLINSIANDNIKQIEEDEKKMGDMVKKMYDGIDLTPK
jgi:hypothetical protein